MFERSVCWLLLFILAIMPAGCASAPKQASAPEGEFVQEAKLEAPEFVLGVGDSIDIAVWRNDDLKMSTKINPSGKIMYPLVGEVQAAGKGITELRENLRQGLSRYLVDPQVSISVTGIQSRKVMVLGEVNNPGVFPMDTDLTVIDAVAKAGGWNHDAKKESVLLVRNVSGKTHVQSIDLNGAVMQGDGNAHAIILKSNDIVYVPTKSIANMARFMTYIANILSPIVMAEGGIVLFPQAVDALQGEKSGNVAITP